MGSFFEIQLVAACGSFPSNLADQIRLRLDSLESEMSLYQSESAISRLNRTGNSGPVSADFIAITRLSIAAHEKTSAYFDVTIQPLMKSPGNPKAKKLVGIDSLEIQKDRVFLHKAKSAITFDGIAKGYAVDLIADILMRSGHSNWLLNFSGNMRWQGRKPQSEFWRIAIWNPLSAETLNLPPSDSGAIASSGTERNGRHLMNPWTGQAVISTQALSVVGTSATDCDILSTALFVMPPELRKKTLETFYSNYRWWSISPDGEISGNVVTSP